MFLFMQITLNIGHFQSLLRRSYLNSSLKPSGNCQLLFRGTISVKLTVLYLNSCHSYTF